ncbi:MAG: hypothetical protein U9O91_06465 [Candidatus Caldatribacteriota bacterium]|nr:hypothetical protein [Candidatus Caldatribacteriota bacterium]
MKKELSEIIDKIKLKNNYTAGTMYGEGYKNGYQKAIADLERKKEEIKRNLI